MTLLRIVVGTVFAIWVAVLVGLIWTDWAHAGFSQLAVTLALAGLLVLFVIQSIQVGLRKPATAEAPNRSAGMRVISSTRNTLGGAIILLVWDAVIGGTYLFSLIVCPFWFLVSVVKNVIQRPGWSTALVRIAAPALTLGIVLANNQIQWKIAGANAQRIIKACDEFHAANGKYPRTLDELAPRYLESIPRAKYCLAWGEFWYMNQDGSPFLTWWKVPPYGRKTYWFAERRWSYID